MLRLIPKILALLILISCGNPEDMNLKKYKKISMKMGYSDALSRSNSRDNKNLLSGIGTEVIYLVPDSMTFNVRDGYQRLVAFENRALTDIETNRVILNLPLDTPLKIYAYRFEKAYSLADIDSVERTPLSFGTSGSFIITSSTSSIIVNLAITPNGEPGIQIVEPNATINKLGGSGTFTIKLNTHPKHQVTIPISVDNTSIATISPESVSFTPTNWSDTKTVTITGKTDVNYSDNTTLGVSIGPTSSDDSDYNQITETFTLATKSSPITPVNLIASAGDSFVSLDWDQVSNATGYNVYYDEMSGVTDNDSVITGITNDNYTFSGLLNNTTYYFRVASVNSNGISALSNEVSATPSSDNLSRGLIAFYRFNGNANDNTSNANNGTVSGAILTKGKDNVSNTAYKFDGINDKITIKNHTLFNFNKNDNLSFSIWVYPKSFGELNGIFSKYQSSGDDDLFLRINDSSGGLKFGSGVGSILISNALNINIWQNIVITIDNGSTNIFINGSLHGSGISSWKQTTNYFSIGCDYCEDGSSDSRRFFDGKIDKLRIYNRILNSSEINSIHASDNTTSLGEWAHWKLDDSEGLDNVSTRHLSITGTPSIDNNTWSLNGNAFGEYLLTNNDLLDNLSLSLRFWIGDVSEWDSILSSHNSNTVSGAWQFDWSNSDQAMRLNIKGTESSIFSVSKNQWIHLVITKNTNKEVNIYVNSSLKKSFPVNHWYMSRIRVGTNRGGDAKWNGSIDDVRIYDYVLSTDNIDTIYQIYK